MTRVAFLVEGDLEQRFFQNVCPTSPVRKINCNGEDVSIEAIAKRIGTLGRLLQKRYSPVVVVFDRERRTKSCEDIEAEFRKALTHEDINVPIIVGIPDRDTENWILADPESFARCVEIERSRIPLALEGTKGKTEIKKLLPPKKTYVETIDGVTWLKKARPTVMRENSPSFARFADALKDIQCWWLQEGHLVARS